jgi:hypothetical protein
MMFLPRSFRIFLAADLRFNARPLPATGTHPSAAHASAQKLEPEDRHACRAGVLASALASWCAQQQAHQAASSPAKMVRKLTPSTAPRRPAGPAGRPLPVAALVYRDHAATATTTR